MQHAQRHPSDQTLLLALDRELSVRRQITLDRHLSSCERCRSRSSTMASVADETSRLCLRGESAPPTAALRRRLQADMAEAGTRWERSVSFRIRKAFATLPFAIRVGASVALVGVVLALMRSTPGIGSVVTPIEAASLPIRALTPGATARVDRDALCAGQLPARSPIAAPVRQAVLRQYRMEQVPEHEYELDYLITPELGGTADPRNLWPERYASGIWNARVKDELERRLPQLVCQGTLDLETAQQAIADNWILAYKKYLGTDRPIVKQGNVLDDEEEREAEGGRAPLRVSLAGM
jgi:anti-sigma factor RsiW